MILLKIFLISKAKKRRAQKLIFFLLFLFLVLFIPGCAYHKLSDKNKISQKTDIVLEMNIKGDSMEETLKNGQKVKLSIGFYEFNPIERGDIVAFKFKTIRNPYVKRVLALPGDKLEFNQGEMFLNGKKQQENYLKNKNYIFSDDDLKIILRTLSASNNIIPPDGYFVLSDNRARKEDSRKFGFLPKQYIIGKVVD